MPRAGGEREDGAGRGAADARQLHHRVEVAAEILRRAASRIDLRGAMQVARTRVVAEAGPQMQHFVRRRIGQRAHVRESAA